MAEGNNEHLSQLGRYTDVFMVGYIANETGLLTTVPTAATLLEHRANSKLVSAQVEPT
jgi:hypothetical protein